MAIEQSILAAFCNAGVALQLIFRLTWHRTLRAWFFVPLGITCMLTACWGVDRLIRLTGGSFPASVALLILLFFGLNVCHRWLGEKKTKAIVRVIDIPAAFSLKFINVLFLPSFVLLPLSPALGGLEVARIICVFLLGYVVVFSITAYLVRGLQYVLGTSKRAVTERAEEMGAERDGLPTSYTPELEATQQDTSSDTMDLPEPPGPTLTFGHSGDDHELRAEHQGPVQDLRHELSPSTVSQQWATMCTRHLDISTYTILLFSVGIPVYFSIGYAMPLHLIISVLAYLFALAVPSPRWQRVLHPLLLSAAIIVCLVWVFALCRGQSLQDGLREYSTNTKYLKLWSDQEGFPRPGAGDILSSILDTSIIALALPMFQYRNELKRNFGIIVPNLVVSAASVFGYPSLCYAIGISSKRSLTFAVRSLTLALANPAVTNLGGDRSLVAVICIMSGILGVLIGPRLLKVLRIPEDDYVTRGVALGANSSAIATAMLLNSDPRAAALSSLSMGLFGTVTVILTSIPMVVKVVSSLVGM